MNRTRALLIAALMALVPATEALAQSRDRPSSEQRRDDSSRGGAPRDRPSADAPRADLGAVVRRVGAGRDGRMLGVSPRGDTVVVRWEYPGGRVADIRVDARSGRVVGED
ncbi:hypothetical protein [Brevundimonas sp.]|jgi:hypothetical protein|uniref:hypothetical protein n=1 Tax=Brevundimonas sp. TaxID=1871086 RepID=UPI0037C0B5D6